MDCSMCRHLAEIYRSAYDRYVAAKTGVFHAISTDLAASRLVDMERAKNDLVEHQAVCAPAAKASRAMAA